MFCRASLPLLRLQRLDHTPPVWALLFWLVHSTGRSDSSHRRKARFHSPPLADLVPAFKRDYDTMSEMLYEPPPSFEEILEEIGAMEDHINKV